MLGLIDSVALVPLALAAAAFPGAGMGVRAGLAVVAAAGVAAGAVILALPHLAASTRALRFRLGRWLNPRTTSRRAASGAWALVSACWLVRAIALFLLLGTLGVGFSFPLALLFLCAGAAVAALPVGPAGAAAQVGASAALIGAGVRALAGARRRPLRRRPRDLLRRGDPPLRRGVAWRPSPADEEAAVRVVTDAGSPLAA
jgi:hypothetical protein